MRDRGWQVSSTIIKVGNLHAQLFGGMWDLGQQLYVSERAAVKWNQRSRIYCAAGSAWDGFDGGDSQRPRTPAELAAFLGKPYLPGIGYITRARAELDAALDGLVGLTSKRRQVWRADEGEELDMDRLRAGKPFWRSTYRDKVKGQAKEIAIVCNISAAGCRSPEELAWTGAAACAVADLCEQRGIRAEVWACDAATDVYERRPTDVLVSVRLKAAGEPLDISTIAILVAPWFLRLGMFALEHVEHSPTGPGYGRVEDYRPLRDLLPADHTGLPSADPAPITIEHVFSLERAKGCVLAAVEAVSGEGAMA